MTASPTTSSSPPGEPLLRLTDLAVEYPVPGRRRVRAVSGVSLEIRRGETLGLVGESGSGKSTVAHAVTRLLPKSAVTRGAVHFDGVDLLRVRPRDLRPLRRRVQMIFQDPASSLAAHRRVRNLVAEGLAIHRVPKPWDGRVEEALRSVGLDPAGVGDRLPRTLSGGQCQRVAIARAIALGPWLLVCDEPVSALDVSVQAQILNVLEEMKRASSLTMLFITHDLAVVKSISDRIAVMYLGKLCEVAPAGQLYADPQHPYTQALLSAIPEPDPLAPDAPMLALGDPPSPLDPPSGCRFRTRCPRATLRCADEEPPLRTVAPEHSVACHFPGSGPPA